MKIRVVSLLVGTVFHLSFAVTFLHAQGPVSTGTIQDVSREDGILRLRPEQSGSKPIIYYGMDKADIQTVAGKAAKLADIAPGMLVSVFYAKQNDRWVVSKVLIPDAPVVPAVVGSATTAPDRQRESGWRPDNARHQ